MASSPSPIQFIDAALFCTSPFALSYTDPEQKWLIRQHLITLFQDFPSLEPSINTFVHNNGTTVNLLNANGTLHISHSTPAITITVWLHENYPQMPPIVYVSSNSSLPIQLDHPFVDPSGATTTPYLQMWLHPRCNLSDLIHNLAKLFSHNHPFHYSNSSTLTHPSLVSKMEAMDRLGCALHYDMVALRAKTAEEIEEISGLQVEMVKRVDIATSIIIGIEHERMNLKEKVVELTEEADVLMSWLKVYNNSGSFVALKDDIECAFEGVDDESKMVLDCLAADRGVEDLIDALDKAIGEGVIGFKMYARQVRKLAREQFFLRARLVKLKGPKILHCPH